MLIGAPLVGAFRLAVLDRNGDHLVLVTILDGQTHIGPLDLELVILVDPDLDRGNSEGLQLALDAGRHLVDVGTTQFIFVREVLGGLRHRTAALRIGQRFPQRIFELRYRSQAQPPPGAANHMRRLAHRLGAAGEYDV